MQRSKHVVIVAGEESGDLHAAKLIKELKKTNPDIRITGIGGQHMQEAGVQLISDLARFGVTGFSEVFRHLNVIRKALLAIKTHLKEEKPDLLVLVDYPGFNLRLARYAKQVLNIPIVYYISPQIWAWKAKRIHAIKQHIDTMAVIFPFEKTLYQKAGVPAYFVGHPLVESLQAKTFPSDLRVSLGLPAEGRIIALLPGSRRHEIEKLMPILRDTALLLKQQFPDSHFIIPIAPTVSTSAIQNHFNKTSLPLTFIQGRALDSMACADFVIVASGTASLECALLEKPMCIIYKSSFITYHLAMKLIKVKFLGLCNLLSNQMIVPEFLQYDCTPKEIARYIIEFYQDTRQPQKMTKQLSDLKLALSSNKSDCSLSDVINNHLN